jgi:hypothetical protein
MMAVTIGTMPGQQLNVYDKRREIVAHGKHEWLRIRQMDEDELNANAVFRLELRARKKHLRDWNIRSFAQLETKPGDMFTCMLKSMRHVVPSEYEKTPADGPTATCDAKRVKTYMRGWQLISMAPCAAASSPAGGT